MTSRCFTAEEICLILKAAKGCLLKDFKCGDLEISFHSSSKEMREKRKEKALPGQVEITQKDERPGDLILDEETKDILNEIEAENVMIQDPAAYEQMILDERVYEEDQGDMIGRGTEARRS